MSVENDAGLYVTLKKWIFLNSWARLSRARRIKNERMFLIE
jgi:hypothetical protein